MSANPLWVKRYDELTVAAYDNADAIGQAAANDLIKLIGESIHARGRAVLILATGNSQLPLMSVLRTRTDVQWDRVTIFHMDEYLGMTADHPASFRRYFHTHLLGAVKPAAFYGIEGDAPSAAAEVARYTALLQANPADVCVLGIGENGHLAFNDPPANFETNALIHVVNLDETCRRQQVGEGHFPSMAAVPTQALSLTIHALTSARHMLAIVPETRKAKAVQAALEGPITPMCPASILRRQAHATLYLDRDSAGLLKQGAA